MFKLVYDILVLILNRKNLQLYKTHGNSFGPFLKKTFSAEKPLPKSIGLLQNEVMFASSFA